MTADKTREECSTCFHAILWRGVGTKLGNQTGQVFENCQGRVLKTINVIFNLKSNRYQEIGQKVEITMDEKIV